MTRSKKRIFIVAATTLLLLPVAARADIVWDPTNFVEAVLEVADDVEMMQGNRIFSIEYLFLSRRGGAPGLLI